MLLNEVTRFRSLGFTNAGITKTAFVNAIYTWPRPVIPVFYDVDPSVVRKQSGCYKKAFAEHENRFRKDGVKVEETQRWREALTQVANLSGWDIRDK